MKMKHKVGEEVIMVSDIKLLDEFGLSRKLAGQKIVIRRVDSDQYAFDWNDSSWVCEDRHIVQRIESWKKRLGKC